MIVGIDPGAPPKTQFAYHQAGGWYVQATPPDLHFALAVAEKPAGVIRAGRTPASVVSPAGWGMAALFSVQAAVRLWVPVEVWKRKLLGASWNMKKEAACANFVAMFGLPFDPRKAADQDKIDAVAIVVAAERCKPKEWKKWEVRW